MAEKSILYAALNAYDTSGNYQRPVFSLEKSQHMHKQNKSVKIWSQLVIEVAREWPDVFEYFSEKLPPKNCVLMKRGLTTFRTRLSMLKPLPIQV